MFFWSMFFTCHLFFLILFSLFYYPHAKPVPILFHCLGICKYLLSTYSVPGTILAPERTAVIYMCCLSFTRMYTSLEQGGLVCCDSWGRKESNTTERLNWTYMTLQKVPVRLSLFFTKVTNLRRRMLLLLSLLCHFYSLDMLSCSVVSDSFDPMDCSLPGAFVNGDSPGKSTGVGCHVLLQGIFPTQVSCIAGRFFTSWATREALCSLDHFPN